MGAIPVFLINNHRIDSVADAEAYVARLREVERVMGEIGANMRRQAELRHRAARLQLRAGARGRPPHPRRRAVHRRGRTAPLFADFKTKVGRLQIAQAEKDAADRRRPRGADRPVPPRLSRRCSRRSTRSSRARRGNNGAWSLPDGAAYYAHRLRQSTTTELSAEQIHRIGLDQVAPNPPRDGADQGAGRLHRHAPAILRPHQRTARSSNIRTPTRAGSAIWPTPAPSSPR